MFILQYYDWIQGCVYPPVWLYCFSENPISKHTPPVKVEGSNNQARAKCFWVTGGDLKKKTIDGRIIRSLQYYIFLY